MKASHFFQYTHRVKMTWSSELQAGFRASVKTSNSLTVFPYSPYTASIFQAFHVLRPMSRERPGGPDAFSFF
jgi:hypothetical protein